MNAPRIAILILTRGRPAGLVAAVQALHATATAGSMRGTVVVVDADSATDVVEG